MEVSPYAWLFAVLGGAIILGIVIAYGAIKSSQATRRQKDAAERGTRDMYHKDQNPR
ncbi:hypothetical protein [Pelagibacterium lacus]|uniref:hypothetical protein n=1 Tax=Pelagibacterium lacus TaxID=2282655 RepID=UPI0013148390|nr:hypothetical protein [Pelagibacterium lacus]